MKTFEDRKHLAIYQQIYTYKDWCLFFKEQYSSQLIFDLGPGTRQWIHQDNPNSRMPVKSIEPGIHIPCGLLGRIKNADGQFRYCAKCAIQCPCDVWTNLDTAQSFLRSTLL